MANISKSVFHGTLAQNGFSWTYSPTENYIGLDTLEFEVTNGISTTLHRFIFKVFDAATPNILVKDDYFYSLKGQYVVCDLLKNDFDMVLNVSLSVQPQNGSLVKWPMVYINILQILVSKGLMSLYIMHVILRPMFVNMVL